MRPPKKSPSVGRSASVQLWNPSNPGACGALPVDCGCIDLAKARSSSFNPLVWLLLALFSSFALHFLILYVPALARIFSIVPLDASEWALVLLFSTPVWLIDEALKFYGRNVVMHGK